MQSLKLFEGHRLTQIKGAGLTAAQGGNVSATTQCRTYILYQSTDIGTLAALHFQTQAIPFQPQHGQSAYGNRSRLALHCFPCPGQLVQRLAVMLERRVHRRHLLDITGKARQYRLDLSQGDLAGTHLQHLALGVTGSGGHAQTRLGNIGLVRIQQILGELGGLPKTQRQDTTGQRVETAGMSALAGIEQPAHLLQGSIGAHAQRLVENQDAVDITAFAAWSRHRYSSSSLAWRRSSATARSISEDRCTPRRTLSS